MSTKFVLCILAMLLCLGTARADNYLFDFQGAPDTDPGVATPGYTIITPETLPYNTVAHYGFLDPTGVTFSGRLRSGSDTRLRDFLDFAGGPGEGVIFRVDVPNGLCTVQVWAGDNAFSVYQRCHISTNGGSSWTLYGADNFDQSSSCSPLPNTYMTTDVGGVVTQDVTIPYGKAHYFANYLMGPSEFLQTHVDLNVTAGYILFRNGAGNRRFNCIEIETVNSNPPPPPTCQQIIAAGYKMQGDVNGDCYIDLLDLLEMALVWVDCVDPESLMCDRPWE